MNIFVLTLQQRANVGQFYMFEFESLVTKQRYRCFPTVTTQNPRYVQFGIELSFASYIDPLGGVLTLKPSGSWSYKLYIVNQLSLTPAVLDLIDSGLVKLEEACEEVPSYAYVSPNEDASADVFLSKDCTDNCLDWTTATFWQLANQNWDCSSEQLLYGTDAETFGGDEQFFIQDHT